MSETKLIGVVGLGFLGKGIAACLLSHGMRIIAHVRSAESRQAAEAYIVRAMSELVEHARFPKSLAIDWKQRIEFTPDISALRNVDFVIESIVEDLEAKNQIFDELENALSPHVPIATNTSSLSVTLLTQRRKNPERFLGMHWAEPAYATRFIELIRGEKTSDDCFNAAVKLAFRAGKEPSLVQKDVPGFVVNRIGYAMLREALHLLETGVADAETIDRSFRHAVGLWASFAGPLRWVDLSGGPALYGKTMNNVLPSLSNAASVSEGMRRMMENNDKGVVNGRGFYNYSREDAKIWEERFRQSVWQVRRWEEELGRKAPE